MTTSIEELERSEDVDRIVDAFGDALKESQKPSGPFLTEELREDAWAHYHRQASVELSPEADTRLRELIDEVLDRVAERAIRDAGGA